MDAGAFAVLEAELRVRLVDVDRIAVRVEARREVFDERPEDVDSLGYQLHNLYGAFEQVFEVVGRFFENRVAAAGYPADLIKRMLLDIAGVRLALLSESTATDLDELRRVRHLFRRAYSYSHCCSRNASAMPILVALLAGI